MPTHLRSAWRARACAHREGGVEDVERRVVIGLEHVSEEVAHLDVDRVAIVVLADLEALSAVVGEQPIERPALVGVPKRRETVDQRRRARRLEALDEGLARHVAHVDTRHRICTSPTEWGVRRQGRRDDS
eukprot:6207493-Pleurochrysis_carterae.AAC.2